MNALNSFYRLFPTRPVASAPAAKREAATPAATVVALADVIPGPRPDRYRSRDFGTGYGRSSGYASARRYATDSGHRLVRVG